MKKGMTKIVGYAIWILIVLLAFSAFRSFGSAASVRAQIKAEEDRVIKMQKDNQELENKILTTQGGDFVEREIRDKLGLVKTGEAVVVLPDADTLRKIAPVAPADVESLPDPNWKKWEKLFF